MSSIPDRPDQENAPSLNGQHKSPWAPWTIEEFARYVVADDGRRYELGLHLTFDGSAFDEDWEDIEFMIAEWPIADQRDADAIRKFMPGGKLLRELQKAHARLALEDLARDELVVLRLEADDLDGYQFKADWSEDRTRLTLAKTGLADRALVNQWLKDLPALTSVVQELARTENERARQYLSNLGNDGVEVVLKDGKLRLKCADKHDDLDEIGVEVGDLVMLAPAIFRRIAGQPLGGPKKPAKKTPDCTPRPVADNPAKKPAASPKSRGEQIRERFTLLNTFFDDHAAKLTLVEKCVWLCLWRHADARNGIANVSVGRLATDLGCDERGCRRSVRSLVAKGYLDELSRGGPRAGTNRYRMKLPGPAKVGD